MTPAEPFSATPIFEATSTDGVTLAVFGVRSSDGTTPAAPSRRPLLLVHGATADHTTWRAVGPRFAESRAVFAMDRRGRGASGDAPAYRIELEFDDLAAVTEEIASTTGAVAVDVVGHSYGGRCGLGASLRTAAIHRLVVYEGAPAPPGVSYRQGGLVDALRGALARGDDEGALTTFLRGIVGMSEGELDAYRTNSVWPARVAAAHTILREVEAEASPAASLAALGRVAVPVLLLLGSTSRSPFRIGTDALAASLADAEIAVIEGAAHAAHHTHADEFAGVVEGFLDRPDPSGP